MNDLQQLCAFFLCSVSKIYTHFLTEFYDVAGIYVNPHLKTVSPSKQRKILDTKAPELAPGRLRRGFKPQELKKLRNKAVDPSHRNILGSQGADGSGLTSAKDLTSTKTPSAERSREPLPCFGRKELINLAQEAMQIPEQEVAGVPSYKRKRIAAPSAAMGRKQSYYTPMPIYSPGSGFSKEGGMFFHRTIIVQSITFVFLFTNYM